jgi:Na+/H+ antiporter NhaB
MSTAVLSKVEVKTQSLKLIEGEFTKSEALSIVNNVVDVKVNFHKIQRLSKTEGNINDACTYDNSRITELLRDKEEVKAFLRSLESKGCNIKISSTVTITVEE